MRSPRYQATLRWAGAYRKLAVTGSQRSGTAVCGRMLAADLGWEFIDETAVGVSLMEAAASLMQDGVGFVLQMPSLLARTDEIAHLLGEGRVGAVVMRRPHRDVKASGRRLGLCERPGLVGCRQTLVERLARQPHFRVLDYADLAGHPLWVEPKLRQSVGPKQTSPNQ